MTRSDMRTLFRAWVNDGGSAPLTTDAVFNTYLTRWFEDFGAFLMWPRGEQTIAPTVGTAAYNLNSDFISFWKVLWENTTSGATTTQELAPTTEAQLARSDPNYRNQANGTPAYYYLNNTISNQGVRQVAVYPPPDTSASRQIRVSYVQIQAALTADSGAGGIPVFPVQTHILGVMYAAHLHYIALNPTKAGLFLEMYLAHRLKHKNIMLDESRENLSFGFDSIATPLNDNPKVEL